MRTPRAAFALDAVAAARNARLGRDRLGEIMGFAARAVERPPADPAAREAVAMFLREVWRDPQGAGERLERFVMAWTEPWRG